MIGVLSLLIPSDIVNVRNLKDPTHWLEAGEPPNVPPFPGTPVTSHQPEPGIAALSCSSWDPPALPGL